MSLSIRVYFKICLLIGLKFDDGIPREIQTVNYIPALHYLQSLIFIIMNAKNCITLT